MKKLISLLLVGVLLVLALTACGGGSADTLEGYFTKGDNGYFITSKGAVKITASGAEAVSLTVEGDNYTLGTDTVAKGELTAASLAAPADTKQYFVVEGGKLTGLTELGKAQTVLVAPAGIKSIAKGAFKDSSVKHLVIGSFSGTVNLDNGCLEGLEALYIDGNVDPGKLTCGKQLMDGSTANVVVGASGYDTFKNHYNWGVFADLISKY